MKAKINNFEKYKKMLILLRAKMDQIGARSKE